MFLDLTRLGLGIRFPFYLGPNSDTLSLSKNKASSSLSISYFQVVPKRSHPGMSKPGSQLWLPCGLSVLACPVAKLNY